MEDALPPPFKNGGSRAVLFMAKKTPKTKKSVVKKGKELTAMDLMNVGLPSVMDEFRGKKGKAGTEKREFVSMDEDPEYAEIKAKAAAKKKKSAKKKKATKPVAKPKAVKKKAKVTAKAKAKKPVAKKKPAKKIN